ncbi:DUF262 domain-containing protein [Campylobacter lari]|nr:DUF262 domain-containing protein [Campylobacter lari]EAJ5698940.1 DUF262 domain-containing protein [Campylobacter lari]EAJ5701942.1 DUF262 domain-containing protein [Campylobacter lari]EAJ5709386.1 DUF262 domain-containing protein [Campylobacter lari]EAL3888349.1 DUF262 domain-containing protein [Campylobacter lari]
MSDIKSINDLFGLNFVIPSYQRGYRWDKTQVRDLLEDIWNFCEKEDDKKDSFYCLQPIIVKKYEQDEKKYKLVDGQQRLTTIYMILSHFKLYMDDSRYESFEIEYETRKDSKDFLKNIQEKYKTNEKESNIDFYYMSKAYEYIEKWFSENNNRRQEFFRILTSQNNIAKNVRIIWHEIEDNEDEREVFSRINSGKIPLTNAELIKALFLNSNNFKKEEVNLRQIEISKEWDEMEYALQNNEFWRFLTSDEDYPARIEFLFKTYYNKACNNLIDKDPCIIYRFFADKLKGDNKLKVLDEIWLEVKKIFLTFKYWYENHKLYHLIGYLNVLENKESEKLLVSLYKESSKKSKEDFMLFIEEQISERVNVKNISEIKEMSYEDNKNEIKKILLLFNIATYLEGDIRFSFDKFISEKWSLEHINPQSGFTIKNKDEKKQWIKEIIDILKLLQDDNSNEQTASLLKKLINNTNENIDDKKFADITNDVFEYFSPEDKHSIANLTLLSFDTNSKLSNHIFAIKRNKLKEDEKNGKFIPLCTKNVFMKYYSEKFDDIKNIYFWTSSDQDSYLKAIEEKINVFIKNGE